MARVLIILMGLAFAGFAGQSQALDVWLQTVASNDPSPTIHGTTNLPDSTKLLVKITRYNSVFSQNHAASVQGGQFTAGPVTELDGPLTPGRYFVTVSAPPARQQSPDTYDATGRTGDELQGMLVERTPDGRKYVEYKTYFTIAGPPSATAEKAAVSRRDHEQQASWGETCRLTCLQEARDKEWSQKTERLYASKMGRCQKHCVRRQPELKGVW